MDILFINFPELTAIVLAKLQAEMIHFSVKYVNEGLDGTNYTLIKTNYKSDWFDDWYRETIEKYYLEHDVKWKRQ